jgi:2',3'-cyclic-nucleotide 2'-phosphodiesterase (5'-nucleotidase family)
MAYPYHHTKTHFLQGVKIMVNKMSLTIIQLNDSHAYFDLHQETFWEGGQAVYSPAGGYARIAALVK